VAHCLVTGTPGKYGHVDAALDSLLKERENLAESVGGPGRPDPHAGCRPSEVLAEGLVERVFVVDGDDPYVLGEYMSELLDQRIGLDSWLRADGG
jgi:hypothetical protein